MMTEASKTIVLVIDSLVGGGAERSVLTIAGGLADRGWRIILLSLFPPTDYPIPSGVTHVQLSTTSGNSDRRLAHKMATQLDETRKQFGEPALVLVNLVRSCRVASLVDFHSAPVYFIIRNPLAAQTRATRALVRGALERHRLRRLFRRRNVIGISPGVIDDLVDDLGARPRQAIVIPNPFDIEEIRTRAAIGNDAAHAMRPFVLCVGHFKRQKRQDLALRGWAEAGVDADLVFLGDGSRRKKRRLQALAQRLGCGDRVHILGWQPDVYAWIAAAELLLVTSDFEGFGRVIVESLAVDTPVVSTDCPSGPRDILTGALSNGLAPMGDVQAISERIQMVMGQTPAIEESHLDRFRLENVLDQYESLVTQ